ncbi:hypothetical protein MASR2M39_04740 [Ignavibacteriales bacterium]
MDVDNCIIDVSGFPREPLLKVFRFKDNLNIENLTFKTRLGTTEHIAIYTLGSTFVHNTVNIKNVKFWGIFREALTLLNTSGSIQNCYFYASSIAINGPEWTNSPPMSISNNLFYRVNHGIYAEYSTIIDNSFIDTFVEAVNFHTWFGKFTDVRNNFIHGQNHNVAINKVLNTVENNIIINFARGIVMKPGTRVVNNIIMNSRECAIYNTNSLDTAVINYNCFYNNNAISNNTALFNPDTTIYYSSDPMFENQDSNNFLLQMFSPLINAGDPNILDGDGSRSDVGLYGGPYGQSYEYKDLPPKRPKFTLVTKQNGKVNFNWRGGTEADFNSFSLYRSKDPQFIPSDNNKIIQVLIHYSQIHSRPDR